MGVNAASVLPAAAFAEVWEGGGEEQERAGQRRLGRAVHLFHAEAREAHPGPDRVGFLDRGGLHGPEAEGIDGLQLRDRAAGLILIDLRVQEVHGVLIKGLRRAYRDPDLKS